MSQSPLPDPADIDAIVFDLGGVLLSWAYSKYRHKPEDWAPSLMDQAWETRLGMEPGDFIRRIWDSDMHRKAFVGELTFEEFWPMVQAELGIDDSELAELFEDYWVITYFEPEVADALRALRPRYRTAALSNAWSNARHEVTERYGLDQFLDLMVISGEFGAAKPDPRIYQEVLRQLAVPAERTLFIDDMPENVDAARKLGIHAAVSGSTERLLEIIGPFTEA